MRSLRTAPALLILAVALGCSQVHAQVANTVHNLSATAPGTVKEPGVSRICVFCHTPHRASTTRALWNRDLPPVTYNLYASSTLEAKLNQPTGASRLCLSCHDGTTALGNLRVPPAAPLSLGPLTGAASQGTDLSDDHPISFVYDAALALKVGELADPSALAEPLPLDATGQLQCTACHDPHRNPYRKFLRVEDRAARLCTACHTLRNWAGSAHATSAATWHGVGQNPWPNSPYATVADNGCENCHRPHAAPHPPRLLARSQERDVCLACHDGSVASKNLEPEFSKPSAHPVAATNWVHDPREDPRTMPRHSTCTDCHNPHQANSALASAPAVPGPLRGVRGVAISGMAVEESSYEYEVCLKCHGIEDQTTTGILRADNTRNIRVKIDPSNPSYHPIAAVGRNPNVSGFEPGYSTATIIYCTDCHNNDAAVTGGGEPRGPHGSRYTPILGREYQTDDPTTESFQTYALCYKCHNRTSLLGNEHQGFPHRKHVVGEKAPCAACHDAHGSRDNLALINFMLRDRTGKAVVQPSKKQQRLEFVSLGPGQGECYLLCHGGNHEPKRYPHH